MLLAAKGCCGESCFLSPSLGCVPFIPNRTRGQAVPAVLLRGSVHLPSSCPALLPSCLRNSLANYSKSWLSFCSAMARSPEWEFYQGFNEMFLLYKYALLSNLPLNLVVFTKSRLTWGQRYQSWVRLPQSIYQTLFRRHLLWHVRETERRQQEDTCSLGARRLVGTVKQRQSGGYKAGKQGLARPQQRELLLQ